MIGREQNVPTSASEAYAAKLLAKSLEFLDREIAVCV